VNKTIKNGGIRQNKASDAQKRDLDLKQKKGNKDF
jgi:hypothetical protein